MKTQNCWGLRQGSIATVASTLPSPYSLFAKKLSLDPRLIEPSYAAGSKIDTAAENIAKNYFDTEGYKGSQLVFCDIGTPKASNMLDNFYAYLEGDTPQTDLDDIFCPNYHEVSRKPSLEIVKASAAATLGLTVDDVEALIRRPTRRKNSPCTMN